MSEIVGRMFQNNVIITYIPIRSSTLVQMGRNSLNEYTFVSVLSNERCISTNHSGIYSISLSVILRNRHDCMVANLRPAATVVRGLQEMSGREGQPHRTFECTHFPLMNIIRISGFNFHADYFAWDNFRGKVV